MTNLEEVLTEVQKNKRVCPQPQRWQQLFDMLPNKQRKGTGWEPPPSSHTCCMVGHAGHVENAPPA